MDGFFFNLSSTISNEEFRLKARKSSFDFSRERKLSLAQLVLTIMSFTKCGIQAELSRLFYFIADHKGNFLTYSKSAFSQARKKLSGDVFIYLNRFALSYFDNHSVHKTNWKGFLPVAIDGSTLILPENDSLKERFVGCYNQTGKVISTARTSIAYDVCNRMTLDAVIDSYTTSEVVLAKRHLEHLDSSKHLLVFDRLYPSYNFFLELNKQGFKYCFRLSSQWKQAYRLLKNRNEVIWKIPQGLIYRQGNQKLTLGKSFSVRLVKIRLSSGKDEILLTNLYDGISINDLKELYAMRWHVEECYKRIKQISQMEYFSGKTIESIEQDFFARILMLNISAMIETQALQPGIDKILAKKAVIHMQQPNRTQIYASLKERLYLLMLLEKSETLNFMLKTLMICRDIVRNERSFERIIARKPHKKALNYKAR